MNRDDVLRLDDRALLAQCRVDRFRASGPGGQKRNKTESAVRLRHEALGVTATATDSRSQHENRARALRRLRAAVAIEVRRELALEGDYRAPPALAELVAAGGGTRSEKARRATAYLLGVAALLDLFAAAGCSVSDTARHLGSTTGQTARLLSQDERVLRRANEMRAAAGLKPLR